MDYIEDIRENPWIGVILAASTIGSLCLAFFLIRIFETAANARILFKSSTQDSFHLPLIEKEAISHDTRRFRFALTSEKHVLGLPVGQHVSLRYTDEEGKTIIRSYTPISSHDQKGYVDLIIKIYFKNIHPKFPQGGKMSQHLETLEIGETIEMSGPKGKLTYIGNGLIHIQHRLKDPEPEKRQAKKILMIAGGTGITPMLQILRYALIDLSEKTEFYLIYANQTENDILCRPAIDLMAQTYSNLKVWYTIDREASEEWKYSIGFINSQMIQEHGPKAALDVQVLVCGPPPMLKFAVVPALEELAFQSQQIFCF